METDNLVTDVLNLKKKIEAGAEHLISQLFFDNSYFYSFLERTQIAGIDVPIEAGIMPVTNKGQIERMVSMCGASLPPKFAKSILRSLCVTPELLTQLIRSWILFQTVLTVYIFIP